MSSILGLTSRGSDVTVLITKVHLHPLCVLVEFWGKIGQKSAEEYECLAKECQSPGNLFQEFEGNAGDKCLVQIEGTWYRCRIVSRDGLKYSVFLIDKGITYITTAGKLAWGRKTHFCLPPEVEFCVLANVLPLSPENRWTPVALEYLRSLSGKTVKANVQDVLVQQRTFVMHIPCISKQMYEMGHAKKLSPDIFQDFVLLSLQSQNGTELPSNTGQMSVAAGERLHKQELFLYPELLAGTVETVIVTDVTNPQKIFCQLKVFSQELKKLSEQITQCCEGRTSNCIVGPEMIGFPCAARGRDGSWYRSVLQQVFPANKLVEVLNVDYGTKQFVQVENVRPLAPEFFRMPVVTYICSLHGTIDKGSGWTASQIDYLRSLLLYKTVIARFEYQSISEGVHYVTLYGDENTNINKLFVSKESGSLDREKTLGDYAIPTTAYSRQSPAQPERNKRKMLSPVETVEDKEGKVVDKLSAEDLPLNSSHKARVQYVFDPSEFWIQTLNYGNELDELMESINHLYEGSVNKDVVKKPTLNLFCAAKAGDGDFYRATLAEVNETQIKAFFVDYGNTEVVDRNNIRVLPEEFKKLPCLALKCTLAGIRPKDGSWSLSACEFFLKAVEDKVLNVHVTEKNDEGYAVQLTDPQAQGDTNIATLMCCSGLGERVKTQGYLKSKMALQPAILSPTQLQNTRLSCFNRDKAMSLNTVGPDNNEKRVSAFKEHMFPIGSVLDVTVSYIESPNDFWCQLVQNAGHLKMLMHDMQAYYAGSEFQPFLETACVARHPENRMWYRALVINKHETLDVDVLFVDYGQVETVSLHDLRRICPQFLILHGQAFRCSLLNPVDPTSATNEWTEEAIARFHNFVETATANFVILKCTVYAVMYSEQKIVFNIVDLETPFESVSTSMVNLRKPKKAAGPSFRLDTYYYSTHNVKTGTEECVTVTCVNNVGQFYCQLERNADVIQDLKVKIRNLCHQLENVKLPTFFGTLCFAKYIDGQWYRGQIKATKPVILVHFVDYGDTIQVEKSDLLPVPKEANDIMSVPVQAVVCSLSDIPAKVPNEVNSWFETSATDCKFRALVVAREHDGKLLVELYHGKTQINSKIKKMFQIEMQRENPVSCGQRAPVTSAYHAQKTTAAPRQATETDNYTQPIKKTGPAPKPAHQTRDVDRKLHSVPKSFRYKGENGEKGEKVKAVPLELYKPPQQRQSVRKPSDASIGSEQTGSYHEQRRATHPTDHQPTNQLIEPQSPVIEPQKKNNAERLPNLEDLPSKSIRAGMEADVYVSHCNSPLSFYVQLVSEENAIFSLVEKLSDPLSLTQNEGIKDMFPGDLVKAEFPDDSLWYRAVLREIHSETAQVEFVDFGNTSVVPLSKIGRLAQAFLQIPMYSTHCRLSDAATLKKGDNLDPEVLSAFKEHIGGNTDKVFKCQFIRQSGSVWEVQLEDSGVNITSKILSSADIFEDKLEDADKKPAQNSDTRQEDPQMSLLTSSSLSYHQLQFHEGQIIDVYVTTTNDAQTFWCQPADSEKLEEITSSVSVVGDAADYKHIDPGSLSPGSPCVALFSDDHLWYRAQVINMDQDELSILFVDYGNESTVKVTDVREMPPNLIEIPSQAFLCELEGFDESLGSWDSGAVDEFSALTTDKTLQLTIRRMTCEQGKTKCLVRMESEGQVINEAMKACWKISPTENEPAAVGPTSSFEKPLECESTVEETKVPEDQPRNPETHEIDPSVHSLRDHGEGQSALHSESLTASLEEMRDQISECSKTNESLILPMTERETEVNTVSTTDVCQTRSKDILPCPNVLDETTLSAHDEDISTSNYENSAAETDKSTEDEDATVIDTCGPDEITSPSDRNDTHSTDEDSTFTVTDLEPLSGEVHTRSSCDMAVFAEGKDGRMLSVERNSLGSTTVKMVPREIVGPRQNINLLDSTVEISEDLQQVVAALVLPLCEVPAFEQESETGNDVAGETMQYGATHVQGDSMYEKDALADHQDSVSALIGDTDSSASEPHTCNAPTQHLGDEDEVVTSSGEGLYLTHVCTDPNEPSDSEVPCATQSCFFSIAEEETVPNESLLLVAPLEHVIQIEDISQQNEDKNKDSKTEDKACAQISDLSFEAERQADCPVPCVDLINLVEEVTCLVREISLDDDCTDACGEAEAEDSREQLSTSPKQGEKFNVDGGNEEKSSSSYDSFEAQLSRTSHLSLLIIDGCADVLPQQSLEQQSEE